MRSDSSTLPPLIERLLDPAAYPHSTAGHIRLIQTPISWVLMTGEYVYKIKKPVKLPFADFSTLELRRHFCGEELRLNRRTAPEIYLGVVAITAAGKDFQIDGVGTAVEYAVKMRQFPEESLMHNVLENGGIKAEQIRELARTLADFHEAAAKPDPARGFGRPELVRKSIDDSYDLTARFIGTLQTRKQFEETKAFTDRFFSNDLNLLQGRIEAGRIRECHGDLHLGNICLWDGKITLFDCIEFNDVLRFIDVMNDAAFVAMDLDAAGRFDLSTLFLNTYVEWTGDWEGLQILRLYTCMRAYVRAMVHSMASDDPQTPPQDREQARRAARRYYQLAWQYTQRKTGRLILVSGVSGSGKSTLSSTLSQHLRTIHIRSDAVRKHLAGLPLDEHGDPSIYSAEMKARTYARLLELGLLLAGRGFCVILDAKYDRRSLRRQAIDSARQANLPLELIQCSAPESVLRSRLHGRHNDVSDATPDLLTSQLGEFEPLDEQELKIGRIIDTTQPLNPGDIP